MADLVCVGELLIDFVPTVQGYRLRHVPKFEKAAGGAPANVAVGFSRLGGKSSFIGKVGNDEFGYFLEETLQNANVDTTNLCKTDEALTTLAFVSLRADGERDFIFYRRPGADTLLQPSDIDGHVLDSAQILHFGSISLIQEPSRSATWKLAALAREQKKLVSFDPNLRPALWDNLDDARSLILQGVKWAHVLKVSEEELVFMVGDMDSDQATKFLFEHNPELQLIAVTQGNKGCTLFLRDNRIHVSGFNVSAVDTTGAGDGFTAALLFALNQHIKEAALRNFKWGRSREFWEAAGRFANATGALVVTHRGGIPSMPTYSEVTSFLESYHSSDI